MYLLNKFLYSIITLFGVVTVIFFLFSVLPGDPAQMMLGQNDNSEQLINIKKKYNISACKFYTSIQSMGTVPKPTSSV